CTFGNAIEKISHSITRQQLIYKTQKLKQAQQLFQIYDFK
ncbi:unnamed protein product, partial [Rotaria socialis]